MPLVAPACKLKATVPYTVRFSVRARAVLSDAPKEPVREIEDLPVAKGIPVMGKALEYLKPEFEMMPLFDELGERFMINLGPIGGEHLAIRDDAEVQAVLEQGSTFRPSWPEAMAKLASPSGGGFVSDAESLPWRRAMLRVMSVESVMGLQVPIMVENFQSLMRTTAQSGEEVKWNTEAKRMAYGVVSQVILGDKVRKEEVDVIFPSYQDVSNALFALDFGFKEGIPFSKYWKGIQGRKAIISFFTEKLEGILQDRASFEGSNTVLGRLLTTMQEEGVFTPSTTNEEIADRLAREVVFLLMAGTDTTGYSMTRAAVWLAQYPEWHEALWKEQQGLMEEYGDTIDRRVLSRSPVATAMAQESMRVRPPIKVIHRTAGKDTALGDLRVPAGTPIAVSVAASGIRSGNGSDSFDPEQWLSENRTKVKLNTQPGMVPFGTGPRSCVGQNLAQVEITLILVLLAREVKAVQMTEEEIHQPFIAVNHPTGCPLKFVPRN